MLRWDGRHRIALVLPIWSVSCYFSTMELPGDYFKNVRTGRRLHWIDVYFLGPIRIDLGTRRIHHARDLRKLTDRDLAGMAKKHPQLRANLWRARRLGPEEPELMSDDDGDPEGWADFSILKYLARLE